MPRPSRRFTRHPGRTPADRRHLRPQFEACSVLATMDRSKQQNPPPASPWQDQGLEFELTDFGEARRVLDNESISQFDVATAVSPAQWKRLRRATLPTD